MTSITPALAQFRTAFYDLLAAADVVRAEIEASAGVEQPADIRAIIDVVLDKYQIPMVRLLSRTRDDHTAEARQVAMVLSRDLTPHSLSVIGDAFRRDHGCALHAQRSIQARYETDPKFRPAFDALASAAREALSTIRPT